MRKFIAKYIGLPIFDILKNTNVRTQYNRFKEVGVDDFNTIQEYQFKRLKSLLIHAYEKVPFYKNRMINNGLDPYKISSVKELSKIPVLTRADLQNHWEEIFASNHDKASLHKGSSSGSTGTPVVYYRDSFGTSSGKAANYIGWELAKWKIGEKGLHIWGNPSTVNNEWNNPLSKLKTHFFNHYKFPAYQLTEKGRFNDLLDRIQNENYDYIDGYTNAIYLLSEYMHSHGIELKKKLKYVFTTAENLQSFQRKSIEKKLGPVYDGYGCSEINGIAYECAYCKDYHIMDSHVIVEYGILRSGEGKDLIITDLDNYGFPLIRYQNGDVGVPSENNNNCKIKFSKIKKISGRISDILYLPDGGALSVPSFFGSMLLKQIDGIVQYQIIREEINSLIVLLVVSKKFTKKDESTIIDSLNEYLGKKINFEIKYVDNIEVSKNGKFKLVIDNTKNNV